MSLIHRYQSNGYNIVLDINSGCIHLVDQVTYEVLPLLEEGKTDEAIAEILKDRFPEEEVSTSIRECRKLQEEGKTATVSIMKKNKKFQKDQLAAQGFTEIVEIFK